MRADKSDTSIRDEFRSLESSIIVMMSACDGSQVFLFDDNIKISYLGAGARTVFDAMKSPR